MHGFVVNPTFLIYFKWALDALAEILRGRQGGKKEWNTTFFENLTGNPAHYIVLSFYVIV